MGLFGKKKEEARTLPEFQQKQEQLHPAVNEDFSKDVALIHSKLDLINARLENIHQRLANLERVAYEAQKRQW
ncbi:MAG TPA: hypothetical protein VJJ75_02170 [Candidatus Nanoarchaeia archaeon]|nr:hypothetical protein [Candidatus Nanoarchaeia archaeon]